MSRAIVSLIVGAAVAAPALAQPYEFTVRSAGTGASTMSSTFNGTATFSGTYIGNYDQATNPTGTRTLNFSPFSPRPGPPTNISKTLSGNGSANGNAPGAPVGTYGLEVSGGTVSLTSLSTNLIGSAAQTPAPVNATVTYQSFMTAAPDYTYPYLVPITVQVGTATVAAVNVVQTGPASGAITGTVNGTHSFSLSVPVDVTATVDFQGSPVTQTSAQTLAVNGTVTPNGDAATASLSFQLNVSASSNTPQPQPTTPFAFPPPSGTGAPANLLLTLTINTQSTSVTANATLPADGTRQGPVCGTSDFNGDGDFATDQDIEAFFACIGGHCCPTCFAGGSDFNGDGDAATDQDIESFFRVIGGNPC
ncbi:MAG TPA: hypothetical protein VD997_08440 [Phycisphaerales bacterium]|nr:hypothetical protein [Phycisphaerales bacterium]